MAKYIFGFAFLLALLSGCVPENPGSVSKVTSERASHAPTNIKELERSATGTWRGTLPCADCPSISYTLILKPDNSFQEMLVYNERSTQPFTQNGNWEISADSVLLLRKQQPGHSHFKITDGTLLMLDEKGQSIGGNLAEMYRLNRVSEEVAVVAEDPLAWQEKFRQGTDFLAIGHEPSWSLDIDFEKVLVFKSLGDPNLSLTVPATALEQLKQGEEVHYTAKTSGADLRVAVRNEACIDAMNGRSFPYRVKITANTQTFDGCGQYLSDYRLNGSWRLKELKGKAVNATDYMRGIPELVFQLKENRVSGHTGCNRFSGQVEVKGEKLELGALATTKMACPGMDTETEILRVLSSQRLTYKIEAGSLTIFDDKKKALVYNKAD